jgi:cystathionine gamma-lyase
MPYEHFATQSIHEGQGADPLTGAVITPISLATTYLQSTPGKSVGVSTFESILFQTIE